MNRFFRTAVVLTLILAATNTPHTTHAENIPSDVCSNGLDDDNDNLIDALVELPESNDEQITVGGEGNPGLVRTTVENAIRAKGFQLTLPASDAIVRSDGGSWSTRGTGQGSGITEDVVTLNKVCQILGYREYVSSTCRDGERSGLYPNGKCNFHTPNGNTHWRVVNGDFQAESAEPKYGSTWIATITCKHRLPACDDGWDNDGDGRIDSDDPGCATDFDDSELKHDPTCNSSNGSTETEQCRDGLDNDNDGVTDLNDPGCSSLQDNDESDATTECQDKKDNDGDGAIDLADFSCQGDKTKNDEASPKAQCQDGADNDSDGSTDLDDPGCPSKQDNDESDRTTACNDGEDNDGDGAIDLDDFSCQGDKTKNDEASPKAQCQDGEDNDSDGSTDLDDSGCPSKQDNDEGDEPTLLSLGIECLTNNADGTRTAYFTYNNNAEVDLAIPFFEVECQAIGIGCDRRDNAFIRSNGERLLSGPPGELFIFKRGLFKGAVPVTFTGGSLTWVVRPDGGTKAQATADDTTPICGAVEPFAECRGFKDGIMTVRLGYDNPNKFSQIFEVGTNNGFAPGEMDRSQPREFFAGLNASAFEVPIDDITRQTSWNINDKTIRLDTSIPECAGLCTEVSTASITDELDAVAVELSELVVKASEVLKSSKVRTKRDRKDFKRAKRRADQYVETAKALTIQVPEVTKTCPEAPKFCATVDRGPVIDQLRGLYATQRNSVRRIVQRAYWRSTGKTRRNAPLVQKAKELEKQGIAALEQLPRFAEDCKE